MSEENEGQEENLEKIETVELSVIEDAAKQQGWSSDKGDLTPLEFLSKGREFRDRLYDTIRDLKQDNEKVYKIVADHISKQDEKDYESEQENIEGQIRQAADDGDSDKVIELTKKLPEKPEDKSEDKPVDPNIKNIDSWIAENKWFDENTDMKADALGFYQSEAAKLGTDTPSVILPKVLKRIQKEYPEKFTAENPNRDRESGADGDGRQKRLNKKGLSRADLTEDEDRHFDEFVKMGMKPEKLLETIHNGRIQRGE